MDDIHILHGMLKRELHVCKLYEKQPTEVLICGYPHCCRRTSRLGHVLLKFLCVVTIFDHRLNNIISGKILETRCNWQYCQKGSSCRYQCEPNTWKCHGYPRCILMASWFKAMNKLGWQVIYMRVSCLQQRYICAALPRCETHPVTFVNLQSPNCYPEF